MKHVRTVIAIAAALSLCGCARPAGGTERNERGAPEAARLSEERSEPKAVRPSLEDNAVASMPAVDETRDTKLAVDFIYDFYETLAFHDESALDLDKYFDDGALKKRMAECKAALLNKTTLYEKEDFAVDYAAAVSDKTMDGAHYITVAYAYQYRQPSEARERLSEEQWSGGGRGAPFVIRDGKILNLAVEDFFAPLPPDGSVPEPQVVTSHITAVGSGSFELDGVTYTPDTDRCDIVIEDGGFVRLLTPEGVAEPADYCGEPNPAVDAVKEIFTLENLGNTVHMEAGGEVFTDAVLYRFGEKLLFVGDTTPPSGFDTDLGSYTYHTALIFSPDLSASESGDNPKAYNTFIPFVKTSAAEYTYIELALNGIDAMNEDGTPRELARLSDEDAEALFELLRQISIDAPPINGHTWESAPDGGYGATFNVCRRLSEHDDYVSTVTVTIYMGRVYLNSMAFPIDGELSSQLSDRYNELYVKYYPDIAEKWNMS